jgi:hypothetical protein
MSTPPPSEDSPGDLPTVISATQLSNSFLGT